ncbi:MAG: helix-turn-helix domain-containing protein [Oscillospiraceae bacterium]|nr:helix-turn-helix domain-containing protein [Oscillospiraceae bacterium]
MNERKQSEFLTIAEVKAILNISLASAYELTHRKDFPVCRFGGSIRVPSTALQVWIQQHTQMPKSLRDAMMSA